MGYRIALESVLFAAIDMEAVALLAGTDEGVALRYGQDVMRAGMALRDVIDEVENCDEAAGVRLAGAMVSLGDAVAAAGLTCETVRYGAAMARGWLASVSAAVVS